MYRHGIGPAEAPLPDAFGGLGRGQAAFAPPPLAVSIYDHKIEADRLHAESANAIARAGKRLAGLVQPNVERPGRRTRAMTLTDLASGEAIAISQNHGGKAAARRLDTAALVQAGPCADRTLAAGGDLLIVNRFRKPAGHGGGLGSVIAEALMADVPVARRVRTQSGRLPPVRGRSGRRTDASQGAILALRRGAIRRRPPMIRQAQS